MFGCTESWRFRFGHCTVIRCDDKALNFSLVSLCLCFDCYLIIAFSLIFEHSHRCQTLLKSFFYHGGQCIAGRFRPISYPEGPITARYRFIKNAYWDILHLQLKRTLYKYRYNYTEYVHVSFLWRYRYKYNCPVIIDVWFQFSIWWNIAGNQKPQVTRQGYIFTCIIN